jgi:hypothetical protein
VGLFASGDRQLSHDLTSSLDLFVTQAYRESWNKSWEIGLMMHEHTGLQKEEIECLQEREI